jgi:membrane protease YdiL (CAAX protease family)
MTRSTSRPQSAEAMQLSTTAEGIGHPRQPTQHAPGRPSDGSPGQAVIIPQYSLWRILMVWAAAALPMGVLSWVIAPLLASSMQGKAPLVSALLLCMTAGLAWQCVLVLLLVRREQGTLRWPVVREALWLQSPRSPRTKRVGGRTWLALLPFVLLFAAEQFVPTVPVPGARDFGAFLGSGTGQAFFHGAWGWFLVTVVMGLLNTVFGEELLFRGLLLPRMQRTFGRADWVANGVLFALYHLHVPWVIPSTVIDSLCLALPSSRYRSAWMGIAVHSTQTLFISLAVFSVVN